MVQYIVRRTLIAFFLMLGAATVVFVLIHLVPGDVVTAMLGEMSTLTPEQINAIKLRLRKSAVEAFGGKIDLEVAPHGAV